jgi:hypothetical protein
METHHKSLPVLREDQLDDEARKAICAAQRVAKKIREQKRLLGLKLVTTQNGKVVTVDP